MTKRILITGGSGLVGSSIKELVTSTTEKYEYVFLSSKMCDLRDSIACEKLFSDGNFFLVIHLASVVGGLYFNTNNNYSILVDNIKINTNILECCRKYKVRRLINTLSTCIFGNDLKYPLTSDQMYDKPPDSSNEGYSKSKRVLSTGSELLTKCSNLEIVSLIPTNIYGYNDNFNLQDGHVLPALIHKCFIAKKNNKPLEIKGQGKNYRQFVFSNDLGKIILHFVDYKLEKQFNQLIVGPPVKDEITIKDLVNKIVKEFGFNGEVVYDSKFPEGQHKKTVSDTELLEYIPDFNFTSLDIGLKKTIDYFIKNNNTVRK